MISRDGSDTIPPARLSRAAQERSQSNTWGERNAASEAEKALRTLAAIATQAEGRDSTEELLQDCIRTLEGFLRGDVIVLSFEGKETVVQSREAQSVLAPEGARCRMTSRGNGDSCHKENGVCSTPACPSHAEAPAGNRICVPILVGEDSIGTLSLRTVEHKNSTLRIYEDMLSVVAGLIASDVKTRRLAKLQIDAFEAETLRLRDKLEERFRPENIVGNARTMRDVYTRIAQVAPSDTTVLVRGESGTGKELVATAVHVQSLRSKGPFVRVNCAALTESLLESELFGHERGAFTGAVKSRRGRIEEAEGGTLFLDEVGDFSLTAQVKLLRVLQEREFQKVGSDRTQKADVRVITATNRDLEQLVKEGRFREDLYYRINVFPIHLPALRERRDDILLLADHFVQVYSARMQKEVTRISTSAISLLLSWQWPGNVRELQNCIEYACLLAEDGVIQSRHLPATLQGPAKDGGPPPGAFKARVEALERDMIVDALKRCEGNSAAASRELGLTPRILRYKIRQLNIDPRLGDDDEDAGSKPPKMPG